MFAVQTCAMHATCFMPKLNIMPKLPFTINAGGLLLSLERPVVMGIVNVTPDSFYGGSRVGDDELLSRCAAMIEQGAAIIDVGACSTRPSGDFVSCDEELERLHRAFELLDKAFPDNKILLELPQSVFTGIFHSYDCPHNSGIDFLLA